MKQFLTITLFFLSMQSYAQNVLLDSTFGGTGIVFTPGTTEIQVMTFDTGGAIISAGYHIPGPAEHHTALTKHDANGNIDLTFGTNGVVHTKMGSSNDAPNAIVILPDNKILLAGYYSSPYQGFVAKYHSNGTLDSSFGTNGIQYIGAHGGFLSLIALPNKLMTFGYVNQKLVLMKLNADGSFDNQFGTNGHDTLDDLGFDFFAHRMILLKDGNLLMVGTDITVDTNSKLALIKLDTFGNYITSFAQNGKLIADVTPLDAAMSGDYLRNVLELPDGDIIARGYGGYDGILFKVQSNGTIDSNFGINGVALNEVGRDIAVQPDGKILLAGNNIGSQSYYRYVVSRLNIDGSLDTSFNGTGYFIADPASETEYAFATIMQGGAKLIVGGAGEPGGTAAFCMMRLDLSPVLHIPLLPDQSKHINIYPNPATKNFSISHNAPLKKIEVYDITGKCVQAVSYYQQGTPIALNVGPGIYNVVVTLSSGEVVNRKLMKLE